MALWMFRAGSKGEYEKKFLEDGRIYLTWGELNVDLSKYKDRVKLSTYLTKLYHEDKPRTIRNWVGQIYPIAHKVKKGDWVILPSKFNSTIHIGEVVGDYVHDRQADNFYYHYRNVKWFAKDIPRSNFGQDLLDSLGAFMTVCQIRRNDAEQRIKAMKDNNWMDINKSINTEEQIVKSIKNIFIQELGYQEDQLRNDVHYDFGKGRKQFDLVVYLHNRPKIVIEIKTPLTMAFLMRNPKSSINVSLDRFAIPARELGAEFLILSDGEIFYCLKLSLFDEEKLDQPTNKVKEYLKTIQLKNWREVIAVSNQADDIVTIHQNLFDYLVNLQIENDSLKFVLRSHNRANRLNKGYYFLGDDTYCAISFWTGKDDVNKTPNIYVALEDKNSFVLRLTCKDDDGKVELMEQIANLVDATRVKSKGLEINSWQKYYYRNDYSIDYIQTLKNFLSKDKIIIDLVIRGQNTENPDINFISNVEFIKSLNRTLSIREQFIRSKDQDSSEIIEQPTEVKLKKIVLNNIGHFSNLEIDLDARVVCILGENGLGKTSILRSIALGLAGVNESEQINTSKLQTLLHIKGVDTNNKIKYASSGSIELYYDIDQLYANKIILTNSADPIQPVQFDDDIIFDEEGNELPSYGIMANGRFDQLIIGFTQERIRQTGSKSSQALIEESTIFDVLSLILSNANNRLLKLKEWIIDLHSDVTKDETKNHKGKQVVLDTLFDIISIVTNKKITLHSTEAVTRSLWVQRRDSTPILFELVSQGYQNVFSWVGYFVMRLAQANNYDPEFLDKPAIVLIDEIDTYLHPQWQKNILNVLVQKFPNARFIITTHSPLVVSNLEPINSSTIENGKKVYKPIEEWIPLDAKMHCLQRTNDGIKVRSSTNLFGGDIEQIFFEWMEVKQYPALIEREFQRLELLIADKKKEKAQALINVLEQFLKINDPSLVSARTRINLMDDDGFLF